MSYVRSLLIPGVVLLLCGCGDSPQSLWNNDTLLEQIRKSGKLKVLTRYDPTTYYEGPEGFTGLEYDLVQLFAKQLGVEAQFIVPDNYGQILARTMVGDAHIAAAGLTITASRKHSLRFAPPYRRITQQLIYRSGRRRPRTIEDLYPGILEVMNGSSHIRTLQKLRQTTHTELEWNVNTDSSSFELLDLVDKGLIDFTVADSNQVLLIRRFYPKLYVAFDISEPLFLAWALPWSSDTSLYDETVKFFYRIRKDNTLAQLIERHYGHAGSLDYVDICTFRKHIIKRLPRYRVRFEEAAASQQMDWRLLAAMGYQESHWNTDAVSPTGVRGIMMLTEATARQLGIHNRNDPSQSIAGGARYFMMRKRGIPQRVPEPDQTWMALAAYNVGHGHLEDARVLTQKRGGNPDKWMDVKQTLPLLTEEKWYRKTRHGYARGYEPVRYVENIRNYYDLLVWMTDDNNILSQATNGNGRTARSREPAERKL